MDQPLVTSGVAAYNAEAFIAETIESILDQSYSPQEIIIVDDGSTDKTPEIIAQYPGVRLIQQTNQGEGAARNRIIQEAQGKYIAFLDHDDKWRPEKLAKQVAALEADPEIDFALSRIQVQIQAGSEDAPWALVEKTEKVGGFLPSTLIAPKATFAKVGFFQTDFKAGTDFDWFNRAFDLKLKHIMIEEQLAVRRVHSGNSIREREQMKEIIFKSIRASIQRKKQQKIAAS
ncbi:glycosyltransferase family 2 protein [Cerasicoccus frondis]|uniref:glycosyltransferase family 2 protein n=1 Tax=Cerasicoccus frondis TaxID=490090 RepID=UPI002852C1E5|nr:glycosyltransferase family A protein [Cerasicoccus frondis]